MPTPEPNGDPLVAWAVEQQAVAKTSTEHNRTAVRVDGCVECGRTDTEVSYLYGLADRPRCRDRERCRDGRAWLLEGCE